jgi:hypothetical protein
MASEEKGAPTGSIRSLITSVKSDAQALLKSQAELTQAELKQSAGQAGGVGGIFGVGLAAGAMGGIFVLIAIAYVMVAVGLPEWAGFGIVALALLIIAGVLILVGKKKSEGIQGLDQAKIEWQLNKEALTGHEPDRLPAVANSSDIAATKRGLKP